MPFSEMFFWGFPNVCYCKAFSRWSFLCDVSKNPWKSEELPLWGFSRSMLPFHHYVLDVRMLSAPILPSHLSPPLSLSSPTLAVTPLIVR